MVDEAVEGKKAPSDHDATLPPAVLAHSQPAPHALQPLRLTFRSPPPHGRYALWVRVGAGGGHSLHLHQPHLWSLELRPAPP